MHLFDSLTALLGSLLQHCGIYLTGGGALLRGLDRRLTDKIGIRFIVAEDPLHCVAKGAGVALQNVDRFSFLMR